MYPKSTLEFLGLLVHSQKMPLSLPKEKVEKIKTQCKRCFSKVTSNSRGTKQIDRVVIVYNSSSSCSTSAIQGFKTPENSLTDF